MPGKSIAFARGHVWQIMQLHIEFYFCLCFRRGAISVTMYNFGSPRVGNKKFAEVYNQVTVNF